MLAEVTLISVCQYVLRISSFTFFRPPFKMHFSVFQQTNNNKLNVRARFVRGSFLVRQNFLQCIKPDFSFPFS